MEVPKVGDEVVFVCGRDVLRAYVVELRQLQDGINGIVPATPERWAPGLVMLEAHRGADGRESREHLEDEGLFWARGWTGPSADALLAAVLLRASASDAA